MVEELRRDMMRKGVMNDEMMNPDVDICILLCCYDCYFMAKIVHKSKNGLEATNVMKGKERKGGVTLKYYV